VLFWVAGLALIVPLWAGRHFPSEDGLAHLAWTEVFRGLGDPGSIWGAAYERGAEWSTPNLAYFAAQYVLAGGIDPHLAQQVILTLTVLAWLAASRALSLALTGTVSVGALASLLLVHSSWLYGGYLSFLVGVPALVASLAIVVGMLRGERPPPARTCALLAVLGVFAYYCHLVVAACFLLLVVAAAVAARRQARAMPDVRVATRAVVRSLAYAALPTVLLFVSYALGGSLGAGGLRWEPLTKTVARFAGLAFFRGFAAPGIDFWIALAVLGLLFAALVFALLNDQRRGRLTAGSKLVVALAVCLAVLYFVVPDGVGDGYNLKGRLQLVMWAWLLPAVTLASTPRVARMATAAILLLAGWQVTAFTRRARAFDVAYAEVVRTATATMAPGTRFDRQLDYEQAGFDGSFIRVLAHAPEDLALHCGCVLVGGYHPSTPFYWVRVRTGAPPAVGYHVRVVQPPGAPLSIAIDSAGRAAPAP
jgi:hypothetical protein